MEGDLFTAQLIDNLSEDGGGGGNKRSAPNWEPADDSDAEEEARELGPPIKRARCFGCRFASEKQSAAMAHEEIDKLTALMREGIARTDPVALSKEVAAKYAQMRQIVNSERARNEEPLPEWTAASILEHWRHHNTDPEAQIWVTLSEVQQIKRRAKRAMIEKDANGNKRINDKQFKVYQDAVKMQMALFKTDPKKMVFYSDGALLDRQGTGSIISTRQKNLYDFFTPDNRTPTAGYL